MTKERAKKIINDLIQNGFTNFGGSEPLSAEETNAFEIAIKALEQLNKVEKAREEMATYIEPTTGQWTSGFNNGVNTCIEILDNLIAESEEK